MCLCHSQTEYEEGRWIQAIYNQLNKISSKLKKKNTNSWWWHSVAVITNTSKSCSGSHFQFSRCVGLQFGPTIFYQRFSCTQGHRRAGSEPSCHRVKAGLQPAQVASSSQHHSETKGKHPQIQTHLQAVWSSAQFSSFLSLKRKCGLQCTAHTHTDTHTQCKGESNQTITIQPLIIIKKYYQDVRWTQNYDKNKHQSNEWHLINITFNKQHMHKGTQKGDRVWSEILFRRIRSEAPWGSLRIISVITLRTSTVRPWKFSVRGASGASVTFGSSHNEFPWTHFSQRK